MNPHIAGNYLLTKEDQQLINHEIEELSPGIRLDDEGMSLLDIIIDKSKEANQYIASVMVMTPLAPIFTRCQSKTLAGAIRCSFHLMSLKLNGLVSNMSSKTKQPHRPHSLS